MADAHNLELPTSSTRHTAVGLFGDHRANDLVLGHVGRLTYVSPEDDNSHDGADPDGKPLGRLLINRIIEFTHAFRHIPWFQTWYGPASSEDTGVKTAHQLYLNWLLQEAPEAVEGVGGPLYPSVVQDAQDSEMLQQPQTRLPLLAYGEIADLRMREPTLCPVLAMAAGASGHVLRIVRVFDDRWTWEVKGRVSVMLANIDPRDEGHWCGGALSINQIKFAMGCSIGSSGSSSKNSASKQQPRWVLVQTAAETLVFEPALHKTPIIDKPSTCMNMAHGPSYITVVPMMRIPAKETGGRPHCDMAFQSAHDTDLPKLAIIDEGGNWSIWTISAKKHLRKSKLVPLLCARGNLFDGVPLSPAAGEARRLGNLHRIDWLPAVPSTAREPPGDDGRSRHDNSQRKTLLLGNATSVNVVSIEGDNQTAHTFNVVYNNGLDVVVDLQVSPLNPSHVFVLTTASVFWFDFSHLVGQSHRLRPKANEPLLLLSCPHLRDPTDRTMKLCLTSSTQRQGGETTIALVYSMKHDETAAFWFPAVSTGKAARYEHHVFRFVRPVHPGTTSRDNTDPYRGNQTVIILPRQIQIRPTPKKKAQVAYVGRKYLEAGIDLFQVISLGTDLSLRSSLCTSSPSHTAVVVAPPFPSMTKESLLRRPNAALKRKAMMDSYADKFVVPDDFEDAVIVEDTTIKPPVSEDESDAEESASHPRTFEIYLMSKVPKLLDSKLSEVAAEANQTLDALRGFQNPSPRDMIQQIIELASEHGDFAYTTLLGISNSEYIREYGADLTEFRWMQHLSDLGAVDELRVRIFDQMLGRWPRGGGATSLYEEMATLCAMPSTADDAQQSVSLLRRRGLLAYAAVQLFFSQISMTVMPRHVVTASGNGNTPGFEDALGAASTPYAAHFPRGEKDYSDTRSLRRPAHQDMPAWLMSSSQDYGVGDLGNSPRSPGGGTLMASTEAEPGQGQEGPGGAEDPVIARLRQYAKGIKSEPPRGEGELRLLSHWQLGSDPSQFYWVPLGAAGEAEEEMQRQAQEARERRRRKSERRAMRDRERLTMWMNAGIGVATGAGVGAGGGSGASFGVDGGRAMSSPATPRILQPSSQVVMSSQVFASSQAVPRQVLANQALPPSSQPTIRIGTLERPKKKKKKKPQTARGFK